MSGSASELRQGPTLPASALETLKRRITTLGRDEALLLRTDGTVQPLKLPCLLSPRYLPWICSTIGGGCSLFDSVLTEFTLKDDTAGGAAARLQSIGVRFVFDDNGPRNTDLLINGAAAALFGRRVVGSVVVELRTHWFARLREMEFINEGTRTHGPLTVVRGHRLCVMTAFLEDARLFEPLPSALLPLQHASMHVRPHAPPCSTSCANVQAWVEEVHALEEGSVWHQLDHARGREAVAKEISALLWQDRVDDLCFGATQADADEDAAAPLLRAPLRLEHASMLVVLLDAARTHPKSVSAMGALAEGHALHLLRRAVVFALPRVVDLTGSEGGRMPVRHATYTRVLQSMVYAVGVQCVALLCALGLSGVAASAAEADFAAISLLCDVDVPAADVPSVPDFSRLRIPQFSSAALRCAYDQAVQRWTKGPCVNVPAVRGERAATCLRCHAPAANRCAKCRVAHYCGTQCQAVDWGGGHSYECALIRSIAVRRAAIRYAIGDV